MLQAEKCNMRLRLYVGFGQMPFHDHRKRWEMDDEREYSTFDEVGVQSDLQLLGWGVRGHPKAQQGHF